MRLSNIQSDQGMFAILELDSPLSLANLLSLDVNVQNGLAQLNLIFQDITTHLAPYFSAVILDPMINYPQLIQTTSGLVLRLDQDQLPVQPDSMLRLNSTWGLNEIANNYAVAKIEMWYHPDEKLALEKKKVIAELYEYAKQLGIDLLLKLHIYQDRQFDQESSTDQPQQLSIDQQVQLQAIEELRKNCHLLALDYPGNALVAATLTAALDHPWIVSLSGDYELAKQQLRTSLENGARGFIASDVFWQEITQFRRTDASLDLSQIQSYLETTSRDRALELTRIVDEQ